MRYAVQATHGGYRHAPRESRTYILLLDVYLDGAYWRDHAWIRESKYLKGIKVGATFTAKASIYQYGLHKDKQGLKSIRPYRRAK